MSARLGGVAWQGGHGEGWRGGARQGKARPGFGAQGWQGTAWRGGARPGKAWRGGGQGVVGRGGRAQLGSGQAWHVAAKGRRGTARCGMARPGMARCGVAWLGRCPMIWAFIAGMITTTWVLIWVEGRSARYRDDFDRRYRNWDHRAAYEFDRHCEQAGVHDSRSLLPVGGRHDRSRHRTHCRR